jgi:TPR repeat protein
VGGGVNEKEAFRWYEKAFRAGDIKAQVCLADLYEAGVGCKRDADEAKTLYKAARAGVALGKKG